MMDIVDERAVSGSRKLESLMKRMQRSVCIGTQDHKSHGIPEEMCDVEAAVQMASTKRLGHVCGEIEDELACRGVILTAQKNVSAVQQHKMLSVQAMLQ